MSEQDFQDQHDSEVEAELHAEDVDPEAVVDAPPLEVPSSDDVEVPELDEPDELEELEGEPAAYDDEE